jgi:hypothetical protein
VCAALDDEPAIHGIELADEDAILLPIDRAADEVEKVAAVRQEDGPVMTELPGSIDLGHGR